MTPERPAFLCPLEIDQRNPDAIIEALTIERDNLLETCESLSQQDANLSARVAELENENRILQNEVDDLRACLKIHTDHAKRTLGIPLK